MQHDDELALRASRGCSRSFETIYSQYASRIALILNPFARDCHELEDLVHDTFCNAISGLNTYQPRGKFQSWLAAVALNTGRKAVRDRKRRPITTSVDFEYFTDSTDSQDDLEGKVLMETLISRLPMERRLVVILRYWLDFTYDEIAHLMEIPSGTARRRMHTALKELRNAMRQLNEDGREYFHVHEL